MVRRHGWQLPAHPYQVGWLCKSFLAYFLWSEIMEHRLQFFMLPVGNIAAWEAMSKASSACFECLRLFASSENLIIYEEM
jgi:hypothetical protein